MSWSHHQRTHSRTGLTSTGPIWAIKALLLSSSTYKYKYKYRHAADSCCSWLSHAGLCVSKRWRWNSVTSAEQWSRWLDVFVRVVTTSKCPQYFSYPVNFVLKPWPICPGLIKRKRPSFRLVRRYTTIVERAMTRVASGCGVSKVCEKCE